MRKRQVELVLEPKGLARENNVTFVVKHRGRKQEVCLGKVSQVVDWGRLFVCSQSRMAKVGIGPEEKESERGINN